MTGARHEFELSILKRLNRNIGLSALLVTTLETNEGKGSPNGDLLIKQFSKSRQKL